MGRGATLLGRFLPTLVGLAMVGGIVFFVVRESEIERQRYIQEENSKLAANQAVLGRGHLGQMLEFCTRLWNTELNFNYQPAAIAWTRQGIDAYFAQGLDGSSLRQVRCTAKGVERGPRVAHPLQAWLPAEARQVPESGDPSDGEWARVVNAASERMFEDREVAFEVLFHPATGRVLTRRWRALAEGAEVTTDPADAPAFARLASIPLQPASGAAFPEVQPLKRRYWTVDSAAAFALLEKELPKGARISELRLEDHEIDVQIAWRTPAFEGRPPAPFGDMSFDEYGTPSSSWWYPREIAGFGCETGATVASVRSAFDEAKASSGRLAWAWYSCSPAYSNGKEGKWHLVAKGS